MGLDCWEDNWKFLYPGLCNGDPTYPLVEVSNSVKKNYNKCFEPFSGQWPLFILHDNIKNNFIKNPLVWFKTLPAKIFFKMIMKTVYYTSMHEFTQS